MNYYNENDPVAAAWLRELIVRNAIPQGDVDERSIEDVTPADLAGYTQCHFFAGIGGWPLALALAGVPANYPVWTGSCPCQPFSASGKGIGFADERHLWPAWYWLVKQCRPAVVFGEQVASKAAESWIDLVQIDMEILDYAFGCVPFPAASVGAPHIRDRTYWMGYANNTRSQGFAGNGGTARWEVPQRSIAAPSLSLWLADANGITGEQGCSFDAGRSHRGDAESWPGFGSSSIVFDGQRPGPTNGQWGAADWLACTDGKWRPVEPGTFPLANGLPARVGRLRGYGNAIVPAQAAAFIRAALA